MKIISTLILVSTMALFLACCKKEIPLTPQPPANTATVTRTFTPVFSATRTCSHTITQTFTPTASITETATGSPTFTITPTYTGTVSCAGKTTGPGNFTRSTIVGADTREYLIHVPPSYSPGTGVSLIINFHGGTGSAATHMIITGMNAKADSAGFIVVYPDGYGNTKTWNAGGCCGVAALLNIDDVQFTRQIISEMQAEFCIDPSRVFACGHSNGAIMSHRLACELSDKIAAICAVGGGIGDVHPDGSPVYYTCNPPRAVPVLQMHGMQDGCYPFNGGYGGGISNTDFVSIPRTVSDWLSRNGCGTATVQTYSSGNASCVSYNQACSQGAEVVLCTDTAAGHCWLGSAIYPSAATCGGVTTTDLNANDAMWEFFSSHPMP